VRASNVDGDLAVGEVEVIKNIAKMLNISASEVDDIISIYYAEEAIKATRLQITYPNGSPY
jgi:ethanolamine utilization microcompartment shell protein EutL